MLLLLNDLVLKSAFHNALTGKLSDVAGMVVLATLGCALWPGRRWIVAACASAGFVYWKSASSEPLIELVNAVSPMRVGRVVDPTDLVVLPLAWLVAFAVPRVRVAERERPWTPWVAGLAVFALASTSTARRQDLYDETQHFVLHLPPAASVEERVAELATTLDAAASATGMELHREGTYRVYRSPLDASGRDTHYFGVSFDAHGQWLRCWIAYRAPATADVAVRIEEQVVEKVRFAFPEVEEISRAEPSRYAAFEGPCPLPDCRFRSRGRTADPAE
jgi:hypothetical protein